MVSKRLEQPLAVDNRPGAASRLGLQLLAPAKPDRYSAYSGLAFEIFATFAQRSIS